MSRFRLVSIYTNMKIKSFYIIGIGGISLSAMAVLLRGRGFLIKGSDLVENERTRSLSEKGFEIAIGHAPNFVRECDAVIYTSAISNEDCDLSLARSLNKPIFSRAEVLGDITKLYKTISVAGSHGKTTTTGMISSIFLNGQIKPNIHIGGILKQINNNVMQSDSDILVCEACEYKDSFLHFTNFVSVILNVCPDHLDYFKTKENLERSFLKFALNTQNNGTTILNNDDKTTQSISAQIKNVLTFAIYNEADFKAKNITEYVAGKYQFEVEYRGESLKIQLSVYGFHNIYNALASIAVSSAWALPAEQVKNGLENFEGVARRFELVYEDEKTTVVHDYAHHPDEIKATIEAGRCLGKKVIVIFQPHTFSRTRDLFFDFVSSLSLADEVWLLPIYPAREKPLKRVSSKTLFRQIKKKRKAKYFPNFNRACKKIRKNDDEFLFLILGAGDIEELAQKCKDLRKSKKSSKIFEN